MKLVKSVSPQLVVGSAKLKELLASRQLMVKPQALNGSSSPSTPIANARSSQHLLTPTRQRLKQVWQRFMQILANDEFQVWHRVDRQGQVISWHVYDAKTGQTTQLSSEMEVRLWLEQHLYR